MSKKKTSTKKQWQLLVICLTVTLLSVVFGSGLRMTMAANWNPPTTSPPGGNTPGPVWLDPSVSQDGGFNLKGISNITDGGTLLINGNNVCQTDGDQNPINCPAGIDSTLDDVAKRGGITEEQISVYKLNIGFDLGGPLFYNPPELTAGNQNLLYGLIGGTSSDGNFLLFERGAGNKEFMMDYDGSFYLDNRLCFGFPGDVGWTEEDNCVDSISGLSGDFVRLQDPTAWDGADEGGFWVDDVAIFGDWDNPQNLADDENLIYGVIENGAQGNLLLLEEKNGPGFLVDIDSSGDIAIRSTDGDDLIIDAGDDSDNKVIMYDDVDIPFGDLSVGGCFGPVFLGVSAKRFPDDFSPLPAGAGVTGGGYVNVDQACKDAMANPTAHVCTAQEMLNSLSCGWLWTDPVAKAVYKGFVPTDSDFYRFSHGAPALPTQTNDCAGWHSNAKTNDSAVWQFVSPTSPAVRDGGTGWALPCSTEAPFNFNYRFACCGRSN